MFLKTVSIVFFFIFSQLIFAEEFEFKVERKTYKFISKKGISIGLKERTIDLELERSHCNKNVFRSFEKKTLFQLKKIQKYKEQKGVSIFNCKSSSFELQVCSFLNQFPKDLERVVIQSRFICAEKKKE
jgi:hypothetical protein